MILAADDVHLAERLGGVSAVFEPGTITALCGPNGAGKSSLLQCLAGLVSPDRGEIVLGGRSLAKLAPRERARAIGYLPQTGEIAWDMPVEGLVGLGRLPHGDRGEEPVARAISALDLGAFAGRRVSTLSGGERGRALLARVLAGEPRWILADEPLAALDLAHQLTLLAHLRRVADAGIGVVVVLHDLALAMNWADRVMVLSQGHIAADGPPARSLSADILATVWGVEARWLGEPGSRALVATSSRPGSGRPPAP